jgi:uncharacterized caspase-like protein
MKGKIAILILTSLIFSAAIFAQKTRELTQEDEDSKKASQKRIALVIGNGAYTKAKPLPNPPNDAADMAQTLRDLGFEVISGVNQTKRQTETLIRDFGTKLANSGGIGLFYYAGHGLQVNGENYLVPVDADIPEADEVAYSAVPISLVLSKMMTAKNDLNIVILDACRNNPFARSWRSFRDSSNNDGLAKISPPTGTLVLYATEPGKVASDGAGRNGLFTEALLKQIKRPNLEYDQMVKALSTDVWQKSNKQQLPWKEGNSLADFYFAGNGQNTKIPDSPGLQNKSPEDNNKKSADETVWNAIKESKDRSSFIEFIKSFPNSKYTPQAQQRLKDLDKRATVGTPDTQTNPLLEKDTSVGIKRVTTAKFSPDTPSFIGVSVIGMNDSADVEVFLNGKNVSSKIERQSGEVFMLRGEFDELNLKIGRNEIYVIVNGVKSEVYIFKQFE